MRDTTDTPCTCWVDRASDELRYQIRYGAHAISCPVYRESGDAVDRKYDNLDRLEGQIADFAGSVAAQTYYEVVSVQPTVTGMSESVVRISHHTSKAGGLSDMLETNIFSDDHDAIQAIEARIADRQAEAARCKEINKQIRQGPGWLARIQPPLTDREKADLMSLAKVWGAAYKGAYPPYHLTGINASIRRDQKRLEEIKSQQARTEKAEESGGVLVEGGEYYVKVTFAEKPTRGIIDALKAGGFSWMGGSWVGQRDRLPEGIS